MFPTTGAGRYDFTFPELVTEGVPECHKLTAFDVFSIGVVLKELGGGVNLATVRAGTVLTTMH